MAVIELYRLGNPYRRSRTPHPQVGSGEYRSFTFYEYRVSSKSNLG